MVYVPAPGEQGDFAHEWTADLPDRYEIVREHGHGGMATVYLATDCKHDRRVALKVLAPELAAGIGAERFLREIQIAAHLNHPHIVPLLDSGIVDGRPFYVMPFVDGESLSERLAREGRLPVEDATRIVRDVGEALAYAHDRGVVHRDIKPGNILLAGGSAVVTDFGIAAALDRTPEDHLTRTGLSVGSVGYMSPEQAGGDEVIDGRSDQYSLACVLFEMLAGRRPFEGRTSRAVLGQQLSRPVPRIAKSRASLPAHIDDTLSRALAPAPVDRFPDVSAFLASLSADATVGAPAVAVGRPFLLAGLLTIVALGAAAWLLGPWSMGRGASLDELQVDTTRYAIFAFENNAGPGIWLNEEQRIYLSMTGWRGITGSVVESAQLQEALRRTGQSFVSPREAARIAAEQGAGRSIVGRYSLVDDSLLIEAGLFDEEGAALYRAEAQAKRTDELNAVFGDLVSELLFRGNPPSERSGEMGSSSYPALAAFQNASTALEAWDLGRAEAYFDSAAARDPDFGRAHLWLALSRAWSDQDPARWRIPARQADLHRSGFTDRDSAMADAVLAQANGDFGVACGLWRNLAERQPRDYAGWYGLAICLSNDPVVMPASESPSGWRFRASRQEALSAYRNAFGLRPSILETFHSDGFLSLRRLFYLAGTTVRGGVGPPPDRLTFWAYPTLSSDTLAFVPYPEGIESDEFDAAAVSAAVAALRRTFVDVARSWTAASPQSGRALAALSLGLAMGGNQTAVDSLVRARELAESPVERLELAEVEVWLRLAFGLPDDPTDLSRVKALADSLLAAGPNLDPDVGAALAALTGRTFLAAQYARSLPPEPGSALAPDLQSDGRALLMFSCLGGPADSVAALETRLWEGIGRLAEDARMPALATWLVRSASLSYPDHEFRHAHELTWDWVIAAQEAARTGAFDSVRTSLNSEAARRAGLAPYDIMPDALYPEAHLLYSMGDFRGAADWLDPTLRSLPQMDVGVLSDPIRTASLLRIAALRAVIARENAEEESARRWARAVSILWSDADAPLHETRDRMRRIGGD